MSTIVQILISLFALANISLLLFSIYAGHQHWPLIEMATIVLLLSCFQAFNKAAQATSTTDKTLNPSSEAPQPKEPLANQITRFFVRLAINIPLFAIVVAILYGLGYLAQHLFG